MRVIIIDKVHSLLPKLLKDNGLSVEYLPEISPADLLKKIQNFDGLVIRSKVKIDENFLKKAPNLKFIARVGAGMESIDTCACRKHNITLMNAPEGNRDAVGEHTLALLLALYNKMCVANIEAKNGIWNREKNRGLEIMGKIVAIIGYGNMGSAFAKRLAGFDAEVIAYDKYKTGFSDDFVTEVSLAEVFDRADVLSIHVPLTDETKYMVNRNFLNNFRKNIVLLNTARGKIVKTSDLVEALKSGKVTRAALDVLEYEKISFSDLSVDDAENFNYLKNAANVIITPHVAGLTHESAVKLAQVTAKKIIDFVNKKL